MQSKVQALQLLTVASPATALKASLEAEAAGLQSTTSKGAAAASQQDSVLCCTLFKSPTWNASFWLYHSLAREHA